jgi:hypothetical protein
MKKSWTRIEARVLPEADGLTNVVSEVVIGMTGVDDETGLAAYRDTLVKLDSPDAENFTAFEDIDEAWITPICEKAAEDGKWAESIAAELEAAKSRPVSKPFAWQVKADES